MPWDGPDFRACAGGHAEEPYGRVELLGPDDRRAARWAKELRRAKEAALRQEAKGASAAVGLSGLRTLVPNSLTSKG